nr:hypothetical protein [Tanacetum cinerariifolium]
MFEHHVEDIIWKYQQGAVKVHNWKLIDSCGVLGTDTIKKGQNLSKPGQNQAQTRKRGKVNSQKSTKEIMEESLKKTQAEVTKDSSKRAGEELEQESAKKQKLDEQVQAKVADDDTAKLKRCLEIVSEDDDDVAIEATPLYF